MHLFLTACPSLTPPLQPLQQVEWYGVPRGYNISFRRLSEDSTRTQLDTISIEGEEGDGGGGQRKRNSIPELANLGGKQHLRILFFHSFPLFSLGFSTLIH